MSTGDTVRKFSPDDIKDDFVPKEDYLSPEFAQWEADYLWSRVWQLACREEELPKPGSYVTYDILDESFIITRTTDGSIKAYFNVCPHRGRRLTEGCGTAQKFVCRFHGWQFNTDGDNIKVVDRDDWNGCLKDEDIKLQEVQCDTWGGAVFINMDPNCEPLHDFLSPMREHVEHYEFEKLRYRWYKTAIVPANWKVALEFFNEFYHVQQAHPQLLSFTNDYSNSGGFGRHGKMWFPAEGGAVPFDRSPRLPPKSEPDYRNFVLDFVEKYHHELQAMVTPRNYQATQRLRDEVPADATPEEVLTKWFEFQIEAAEADGSGWPAHLTPEYMEQSGLDWHVFPNTVFLHGLVDGVLWYRARPNGTDHESCIFDVWSLERYPEGKEPALKREFYENWTDGDWPRIYVQDFVNIPEVQKGLRSRAFKGARTNPVQERAISHFHRTLREFMHEGREQQQTGNDQQ